MHLLPPNTGVYNVGHLDLEKSDNVWCHYHQWYQFPHKGNGPPLPMFLLDVTYCGKRIYWLQGGDYIRWEKYFKSKLNISKQWEKHWQSNKENQKPIWDIIKGRNTEAILQKNNPVNNIAYLAKLKITLNEKNWKIKSHIGENSVGILGL